MESNDAVSTRIPFERRPAGCAIPLTIEQILHWNQYVDTDGVSDVGVPLASVRVCGPLDISTMTYSLDLVLQRHESLRTRFVASGDMLTQDIDVDQRCSLEIVDLSSWSFSTASTEASLIAEAFIRKPVSLFTGPVFRAQLIRLGALDHVLVLSIGHIVSDAASCVILSRDLWSLYGSVAEGRSFSASLPPLPLQFPDYAVWQHKHRCAAVATKAATERFRLAGAPRLELPLDTNLSQLRSPTLTLLEIPLGKVLSAGLVALARSECTLLSLVVLTICIVLISRWCDQRDVVLALATHGRHHRPELKNMIGLLSNALYIRVEVSKEDTFRDVLRKVNVEFRSTYMNIPIGSIEEAHSHAPELMFNWLPTTRSTRFRLSARSGDQVEIEPFPVRTSDRASKPSSIKLVIGGALDQETGVGLTALYRSDLLARSAMDRLERNMRLFAARFVHDRESSVSALELC